MEFYVHTYYSEDLSRALQKLAFKNGYEWGGYYDKEQFGCHIHGDESCLIFSTRTKKIWYHRESQMPPDGIDEKTTIEWSLDEAFGYFEKDHPAKSVKLNDEHIATFETEGYVTVGCQKVLYKNWETVNDTIQKLRSKTNG